MSELEVIQLRKQNLELINLTKKQSNSIIELGCLLTELNKKLIEVESEQTAEKLKAAFNSINNLIKLKVTRALNYKYVLTDDDKA